LELSPLLITLLVAIGVAAAAAPIVISLMWQFKILDAPDGVRKLHGRTVPLAGGLAVLLGVLVGSITGGLSYGPDILETIGDRYFLVSLVIASIWICALGVLDDMGRLRGRQKFLGQIVAALILATGGCVVDRLAVMNTRLELGMLKVPFTVFWIVGAINAVNLIDGIDGLATSLGAILGGAFALMAMMTNHDAESIISVALCGALIGFLPFNFPRAKIFLGDTGSMLIGMLLGTLALRSSVKSQASLALVAPVAILSILIFDVGMAILRRKLTGRSLYSTDRGHLHHRLTQLGFSSQGVVLFVSLACALCSAGALAGLAYRNEWIAVTTSGLVLIGCMSAKIFGHNECRLLFNRVSGFTRSLFRLPNPCGAKGQLSVTQIQGHLDWTPVWDSLKDYATERDLVRAELHISAPRVHEHYHADWSRRGIETDRQWVSVLPLVFQGMVVGQIRLAGECDGNWQLASSDQLAEVLLGLKPIEIQIEELLLSLTEPRSALPLPGAAA
jgi:UDP-GlcNAc:undecaprenyl-phosphate GlcNAc-1-phosphate transferase